jgi:hypothetical protein
MRTVNRNELFSTANCSTMQNFLHLLIDDSRLRKKILHDESPILLHGSPTKNDVIRPNISQGGINNNKDEPLVYATDSPIYALFLGVLDLRSGSAGISQFGDITVPTVDHEFITSDSTLTDGFVHVVQKKSFISVATHEFTTTKDTDVLLSIPTKPSDLKDIAIF